MSFHVGQRIICVSGKSLLIGPNIKPAPAGCRPVRGRIYTIRDIDARAMEYHGGYQTIRLEEIVCPIENTCIGLWEPGFFAHRFRPVIERKTSIAVFTAMLTPSPTKREPVA